MKVYVLNRVSETGWALQRLNVEVMLVGQSRALAGTCVSGEFSKNSSFCLFSILYLERGLACVSPQNFTDYPTACNTRRGLMETVNLRIFVWVFFSKSLHCMVALLK